MGKKFFALLSFGTLFGCSQDSFVLEPPDHKNLVHVESGLYVHREVELRVNAARLETPPDDAAPGAVPVLVAHHFFSLGTRSASFIPSNYERRDDDLVWSEVTHVSDEDFEGNTALGASVRWEKDGAVSMTDVLEIFPFPPPETGQIDHWSPWAEASARREGVFGWHAEANKHAAETVPAPLYPFEYRFRLVLSRRMYP
ncbi:MAG: hypothetical protein ACU833_14470 [Gammaproteobacteria bacterium]